MDEVLFCPFCGEAFEGLSHCPEHELALLPWAALPRPLGAAPIEGAPLAWFSPRLGRGWLAGAVSVTLLAFALLPLARVDGALRMGGSMLSLALANSPRLWLVPAAGWAALLILYRRRTPNAMRGARLALMLVGCVPAAAVAWAFAGAKAAVALLDARLGGGLRLHVGAGSYAIWIATLPWWVAAARLGSTKAARRPGGPSRRRE
jgi:hypothetical protein